MSVLPPSDVDVFGKILGLLASDHDGERAAAARKATDFLRSRKLHWVDVTEQLRLRPAVVERAQPPRAHQINARRCLASGMAWTQRELDFLKQMAAQISRPTEKQAGWLDGLLDRAADHMRGQADEPR